MMSLIVDDTVPETAISIPLNKSYFSINSIIWIEQSTFYDVIFIRHSFIACMYILISH